ncbi:MAG: putative baseplate assembly protein [Betaproteobacteria bacterium]
MADCLAVDWGRAAPSPEPPAPVWPRELMAADYDSLLRLMLDRLAARMPGWQRLNEADLGLALLELFAYAGDQAAYLIDRVALEGYLRTASQRESVAKLARLIDYALDPGAAAETLLVLQGDGSAPFVLPRGFAVATDAAEGEAAVVFETAADAIVDPQLSALAIAAVAADGTSLTLNAAAPAALQAGQELVLIKGRLRVQARVGAAPAGALVPLSAPLAAAERDFAGGTACGNLVAASHGETHTQRAEGKGAPEQQIELDFVPLTQIATGQRSARSTLEVRVAGLDFTEVENFLASSPTDPHYRLRRANDGGVTLVFGDGRQGRAPALGQDIELRYRSGLGSAGRVGADRLRVFKAPALPLADQKLTAVFNPFAVANGRDPEPLAQARQQAPYQLVRQNRAVTAADYEALARRGVAVAGTTVIPLAAKARLRQLGAVPTMIVSLDLPDHAPLTAPLRAAFAAEMRRYKLAGVEVQVEAARYAPLHLGLKIEVAPEVFARDVVAAVAARIAEFFAAGRFNFGAPLYLSDLIAVLAPLAGVRAVAVTRFKRLGDRYPDCEAAGLIAVGALEIIRCDNDPLATHNGIALVRSCGGRDG